MKLLMNDYIVIHFILITDVNSNINYINNDFDDYDIKRGKGDVTARH